MEPEMEDLLDVLLSEFEERPFSMEDAMDYVGFGEKHLVEALIRKGKIMPGGEGLYVIKDVELYYGSECAVEVPDLQEMLAIVSGEGREKEIEKKRCEEEGESS